MKIAILTFSDTINYGANLQMFALQHFIKLYGYDCDVINYKSKLFDSGCKIISLKFGIKRNIKSLFMMKNTLIKRKKILDFQRRYISFSKIYNNKNIFTSSNCFDKFIVGSDQIWNLKLTNNDYNYFLPFEKNSKKKYSYAASFGFGLREENTKIMVNKYLKDFSRVLVRETEAKEFLNDYHIDSKVVLDPTLLLEKREWNKLVNSSILRSKKKYVLVYKIANTPYLISKAKEYSKKYNLDIIVVHNSYKKYSGVNNYCDCGIEEFLSLIKNADTVFTSSFHGLCFSIIFEKRFFYELENTKNNSSSRLETLADALNLSNRKIVQQDQELTNDLINYESVNKNLDNLREYSKKEIISILQE